jgi:hypothetical protein
MIHVRALRHHQKSILTYSILITNANAGGAILGGPCGCLFHRRPRCTTNAILARMRIVDSEATLYRRPVGAVSIRHPRGRTVNACSLAALMSIERIRHNLIRAHGADTKATTLPACHTATPSRSARLYACSSASRILSNSSNFVLSSYTLNMLLGSHSQNVLLVFREPFHKLFGNLPFRATHLAKLHSAVIKHATHVRRGMFDVVRTVTLIEQCEMHVSMIVFENAALALCLIRSVSVENMDVRFAKDAAFPHPDTTARKELVQFISEIRDGSGAVSHVFASVVPVSRIIRYNFARVNLYSATSKLKFSLSINCRMISFATSSGFESLSSVTTAQKGKEYAPPV